MAKRTINLDTKDIQVLLDALETSPESTTKTALVRKLKNNMKTIKISSRKSKGRGLQQFVCSEVSELLGIPYDQSDDESLIRSREMGQAGVDVVLRGDAQKRFPFNVECKCTESLSLTEVVQQAEANTKEPYNWLIVHKRKALSQPVVILNWSTFRSLFEKSL